MNLETLKAHHKALALLAATADPAHFYFLDQEMEALEIQIEIQERQGQCSSSP